LLGCLFEEVNATGIGRVITDARLASCSGA